MARLDQALRGPGCVRQRLRAVLERLASLEVAHLRRRGCLALSTAAEPGGHDASAAAIVRSVFRRMERSLQAAIEGGQRSGEIAPDCDAQQLAACF